MVNLLSTLALTVTVTKYTVYSGCTVTVPHRSRENPTAPALPAGSIARGQGQNASGGLSPPAAAGVSIDKASRQIATERQQQRRADRLAIGHSWFQSSGAEKLQADSEGYYQMLLEKLRGIPSSFELNVSSVHAKMREIELTVETLDFSALKQPVLKATMIETAALVPGIKAGTQRLLQSLCLRLHLAGRPGPIDGWRSLAMLLLAFAEEETAFWLLVVATEELHAHTCLGTGPAEFSGFLVESAVLGSMVIDRFSSLAATAKATRQDLGIGLSLLGRSFLIALTIDCLPMEANLHVMTRFFSPEPRGSPHSSFVFQAAAIGAFGLAEEGMILQLRSGRDLLSVLEESFLTLDSVAFGTAFDATMASIDGLEVQGWRSVHREALASQWGRSFSLIDHCDFPPSLTPREVGQVVTGIRVQRGLGFQGMTCEDFLDSLGSACPHVSMERARRLYLELDGERENFIDYGELVSALAVLMEGGALERTRLCFEALDWEEDEGSLSTSKVPLTPSHCKPHCNLNPIAL